MEEQSSANSQGPEPASEPAYADKKPIGIIKITVYVLIAIAIIAVGAQIVVADKYQAQVIVIEGEQKVGVNPTTESLDFGDLSGDTSAVRRINLKAAGMDTFVHISKFGEIGELIKVSENNFILEKGDEKKIELTMYMPPSAPANKKYAGQVWVFKLPKFW